MVDSIDYNYEYEFTTRLLILVHKLQNSDMPIFIMPLLYGSPIDRSLQAQAAAIGDVQHSAPYKGMMVTLCPLPHYKLGMTATNYHEEKQMIHTVGVCLAAHLTT